MRPRIALFVACLALATGGVLVAAPAAIGAGGGGCQLNGTADFSPNGPGATQNFSYRVLGALSSCQSNAAGAPASGTFEVGQQVVKTVTITNPDGTTTTGQATYQEPAATGSGALPVNSCPGGTTNGIGVVTWPDGSTTVVEYATTSAAAAVQLSGDVIDSVTLTLASGPAGAPATYTLSTTNPNYAVGDGVAGALSFTTSDPTPCTTATGLSSVDLQGFVGIGNTNP